MKVVVAGKGGAGKTTVAGTLARTLGASGHRVVALDADTNPMLGISLGLGAEETEVLLAVRQGLDTGETEHERSPEGFVERFGRDAPDGVRLVVACRIEHPDPACPCCGVSAESLLRQLDPEDGFVIGDLEAGVGTVRRLRAGDADLLLLIVQPTAKSIDVGVRALGLGAEKVGSVLVVANRIRDADDLHLVQEAFPGREVWVIPDDDGIGEADRWGRAPLDAAPASAGVHALAELAQRLATGRSGAPDQPPG